MFASLILTSFSRTDKVDFLKKLLIAPSVLSFRCASAADGFGCASGSAFVAASTGRAAVCLAGTSGSLKEENEVNEDRKEEEEEEEETKAITRMCLLIYLCPAAERGNPRSVAVASDSASDPREH